MIFMKISIIIPVYNVAEYIEECLNSVIAQTYMGDMECLIVDDCGTDNSIAIAERIIQNYQGNIKFQILHHDHNRGLSAARNTGIKASTGDYVYFLDSDDYITIDCIETLAKVVNYKGTIDLVQSNYSLLKNDKITPSDFTKYYNIQYTEDKDYIIKALLDMERFPVMAWNRLVNRIFILRNGLFFQEGIYHEDNLWTFFLAKAVNSMYINYSSTYIYLIREDSIMGKRTADGIKVDSLIYIMHSFIENIDSNNESIQKQFIFNRLKGHYFYYYDRCPQYSQRLISELKYFSRKCAIIGKFLLLMIRIFPINIIKRRFFNVYIFPHLIKYI